MTLNIDRQPRVRLPEVDAVVVGLGWAGGIIAAELAAAGLRVVGIERGPNRSDQDPAYTRKHDELRYKIRSALMQDASIETWTLRHDLREPATPMRYLGAFRPGTGVGGASVHYGGQVYRFGPWDFEIHSRTTARYGEEAIPADTLVQDWGITYEDLEPYYDRFERVAGVAGSAGNINGVINDGGNPYEGRRSSEFPLPPLKPAAGPTLFREACLRLGLHPFPPAGAILSTDYTNSYGISRKACTYCGDCSFHACAIGAKGDSRVTALPVALSCSNFELRANANVFRVLNDGKRATGVLYHDLRGDVIEQPAQMVILAAYALNNVRLLLMSNMGTPYDPVMGTGVVGRNYTFHYGTRSIGFFRNRTFKRYMGAGAAGYAIDDFNSDNFDHSGLGFIGGSNIQCVAGGAGPVSDLAVPPQVPGWGEQWRDAIRLWYDRTVSIVTIGDVLAHRMNFLDLDPTYTDAWGNPLLRITFDWRDNERRIVRFAADHIRKILAAMEPDEAIVSDALSPRFDTAPYQSTHNAGGAIMGSDPSTSVVNSYLQMWDFTNVWVVGGSALPQNPGHGPTGTIGALAFRASDGILTRYLNQPGLVV